jgi:hypothetical protein
LKFTHNTGSSAVWNLKAELWVSLLVEEKYQEEKACYRRRRKQKNNLIINKIKVKWSRNRPSVAQGVGKGIAVLFHDRNTRRWWVINKAIIIIIIIISHQVE